MRIKAKETKTIETIEEIDLEGISIEIRGRITATGKDGTIYELKPSKIPEYASFHTATITADGIKFNCELSIKEKF